jgi:hypothetical protein
MLSSQKIYIYRDLAAGFYLTAGPLPSYDPIPPPILIHTGKGGELTTNQREGQGATVRKAGSKIYSTNMTDCISSL